MDRSRKLDEVRESDPEDAVVFVGICLALGVASRHLLRGSRVPYTVALFVLGIALGSLEYGTKHGLGKIGAGINLWANINPNLLLAVFLPALLFESSFSMEIHQIKRCIAQMVLLAGPGVIISTFCLGAALKYAFPYKWGWETSLLLGGLLSATDPVAVVALLKELGASKKLSTIIEGESLMNDGTAIVVYQLLYRMALGERFSIGDIIKFLSQVSLGAIAVGLAFGILSFVWLGFIFNDTVIEIALTLCVSYIAYFTAQNGVEVSGILTVMTIGIFYAAVARTAFKGDGQQSLHHFWEMVSYIANTLIFILSGVVIAEGILQDQDLFQNHGVSWGYLVLLYVFVQLSRVIVVAVLYPFLKYFGYGLNWKEALILIWSGLRGAVALSLSLSVKRASDSDRSFSLTPEAGTLFVFFTGGIVFLSLVINGSTTQFMLHFLQMDKLSAEKVRVLKYTKYEMLNKALEAFSDLRDDEELGPADWPSVKKYIKCLDDLQDGREHPHDISEAEDHLNIMNLRDIRVRLLNGESEIASVVIGESNVEGEEARKFLEDVRLSFPQVLRVVKTKQVTFSILRHLSSYVQNLEKVGLLEKKEMFHLDDVIQTDLKKLLRKPPLVKMPRAEEMLSTHPLFGALPSTIRSPLQSSTKELIKTRGLILYKEGSKPNGVWLVSNGIIKWASKVLGTRHSLHPMFSHGSTLGLYEVLTGKPYLCDMVSDSVVRCFFIEAAKILSLMLDPAMETFLWLESATVVAKLLLPMVFEKLSLQDLRVLIAEKSTMKIYIRGEVMELRHNSVCILLEGFVKAQGSHLDLIGAPAVLLSPYANLSTLNLRSTGGVLEGAMQRARAFGMETRARVVVFEMGVAFEGDKAAMQRQPSWDLARTMSNERHSGMLCWPEQSYGIKTTQPTSDQEKRARAFSAKALELGFFGGSMNMGDHRRHVSSSSIPAFPRGPPRHSLSAPQFSTSSTLPSRRHLSAPVEGPFLHPLLGPSAKNDDSSDDSAGEDTIVQIDSPSHIFPNP
ncbi:sodium proton exchanger, putative (NHX7) (SOS1) isoform X2 [Wolffia australiana]